MDKIKENFIKQDISQITIYKKFEKKLDLINENHPKLLETMSVTKSFLALAVLFLIQDIREETFLLVSSSKLEVDQQVGLLMLSGI